MLPKLDLPKYSFKLPSTGESIFFRPFVVKEEKILLLALQENDPEHIINAIAQIIEACSFGKVTIDSHPQIDIEYLFLNIRNKSLGEGVDVSASCSECEKKSILTLDLTEVKVKTPEVQISPEIQISDKMWLIIKHPSLRETYKLSADDSTDSILKVVVSSIDSVIDGDQTYSMRDYSEEEAMEFIQGLTKQQFQKISAYFENQPKLVYTNKYKCTQCGHENTIVLEGLQNFFG